MSALLGLKKKESGCLRVKIRGLRQFSDTMKSQGSLSEESGRSYGLSISTAVNLKRTKCVGRHDWEAPFGD